MPLIVPYSIPSLARNGILIWVAVGLESCASGYHQFRPRSRLSGTALSRASLVLYMLEIQGYSVPFRHRTCIVVATCHFFACASSYFDSLRFAIFEAASAPQFEIEAFASFSFLTANLACTVLELIQVPGKCSMNPAI